MGLKSGDASSSRCVTAFCSRAYASERSLWTSSSQRNGSAGAAAEAGSAIDMRGKTASRTTVRGRRRMGEWVKVSAAEAGRER